MPPLPPARFLLGTGGGRGLANGQKPGSSGAWVPTEGVGAAGHSSCPGALASLGSTEVPAHTGAPASVTVASGMGHPHDRPSPGPFAGSHGEARERGVLLLGQ